MATGALDANGIWQYGEDDSTSPWSPYMNLGQGSTTTQVGLLKAATADSGWIIPASLGGSWADFDATEAAFARAQYRKKNGWTEITGAIKNGATGPANVVFTLPAGYRPRKSMFWITPANAGVADVRVNAAGQVYVQGYYASGTNGIVSLDLSFIADA